MRAGVAQVCGKAPMQIAQKGNRMRAVRIMRKYEPKLACAENAGGADVRLLMPKFCGPLCRTQLTSSGKRLQLGLTL